MQKIIFTIDEDEILSCIDDMVGEDELSVEEGAELKQKMDKKTMKQTLAFVENDELLWNQIKDTIRESINMIKETKCKK